jgi:uncharacterized protein
MDGARKLAVVTGASSGIGLELARCAARDGCDLVICANEPETHAATEALRKGSARVEPVEADRGTEHGRDTFCDAIESCVVDQLIANAGRGRGHAFIDQNRDEFEAVAHDNVTGTTSLLHRMVPEVRARSEGRILITGSVSFNRDAPRHGPTGGRAT